MKTRRVLKIVLTTIMCLILAGLIPTLATTPHGRQSNNRKQVCSVCKGKKKCSVCKGSGLSGQVLNFPWGSQPLECLVCGGKCICTFCNGIGTRAAELAVSQAYSQSHYNSGYNNNGNRNKSNRNHNNNSRSCTVCGGTGIQTSVAYENDPYGASYAIGQGLVGYTNRDGNRCYRCGRYTYHLHYKCYRCNNR